MDTLPARRCGNLSQFLRDRDGVARIKASSEGLRLCSATRPKWRDEAQRTGRTIEVQLDLTERSVVLGNPAELREVLTNLVLNAVDAMPSGGRLTISLRTTDEFAVLEVADRERA